MKIERRSIVASPRPRPRLAQRSSRRSGRRNRNEAGDAKRRAGSRPTAALGRRSSAGRGSLPTSRTGGRRCGVHPAASYSATRPGPGREADPCRSSGRPSPARARSSARRSVERARVANGKNFYTRAYNEMIKGHTTLGYGQQTPRVPTPKVNVRSGSTAPAYRGRSRRTARGKSSHTSSMSSGAAFRSTPAGCPWPVRRHPNPQPPPPPPPHPPTPPHGQSS